MTQVWDPDFLERSPMFEPLRAHAAGFPASWPELADLQRLLALLRGFRWKALFRDEG